MLDLNYYFVDVGENYCTISERNCWISLRDAYLRNDSAQLKVAKELIVRNLKGMFKQSYEYKIVFVNKLGKMFIVSQVEDSLTKAEIEPLVSSSEYDIYLMLPNHDLSVQCQVIEHEVEYRFLKYEDIRVPKKRKVKK